MDRQCPASFTSAESRKTTNGKRSGLIAYKDPLSSMSPTYAESMLGNRLFLAAEVRSSAERISCKRGWGCRRTNGLSRFGDWRTSKVATLLYG